MDRGISAAEEMARQAEELAESVEERLEDEMLAPPALEPVEQSDDDALPPPEKGWEE